MPKYDYKCFRCLKYFELERSYKDLENNVEFRCPDCGGLLTLVILPTGLPNLSNKACPSRKWEYGKFSAEVEDEFDKKGCNGCS